MNISVLIRLMPATRTGGRLAGQAEIVETGQTVVFAGHAEVLAFLDQVAAGMLDPGAGSIDLSTHTAARPPGAGRAGTEASPARPA